NAGELGKLDAERIKLETQIDKIAGGTKYNGIELLNGKGAGSVGFNTNFNAGTNTTVLGAKVSSASTDAPNAVYTMTNVSATSAGTPGAATLGADAAALTIGTTSTTNINAAYTVSQDATGQITGVTSVATGAANLLTDPGGSGAVAFGANQVNAITLSDGTAMSLTMAAVTGGAATTSTIAVTGQAVSGTGNVAITNATGTNVGNVAFQANSTVDAQLDDGSTLSINFGATAAAVGGETNTVTISGQEAFTAGANAGLTSASVVFASGATKTYNIDADATGTVFTIQDTSSGSNVDVGTVTFTNGTPESQQVLLNDGNKLSLSFSGTADTANVGAGAGGNLLTGGNATAANMAFQVGANNVSSDQVNINLGNSYTTASLGLGTGDLTTQFNAQSYITTAQNALDKLITQRADLGATQNQLDYASANLASGIEQAGASVSAIKDADMALEMAEFTKNKILVQAGTSMLAQANQASQNVMSLFR
ncbi:MAG: flagellin, partial [Mariprofundaceae bacterium]|nr:flagellin [Mariprofundaceae bacterium]